MTNDDIKIEIIRKNHLYSEAEIEGFKYSNMGIPLKTESDWVSKGYEIYDNAKSYKTTLWIKKKNEGFIKRNVTLYSGHDVYMKEPGNDDFDTGIWRDIEQPDEAWENIGKE